MICLRFVVTSLKSKNLSPLIYQYVNQRLYDGVIRSNIPSHDPHINTLNEDEQNIIRYATGYILSSCLKVQKGFPAFAVSAVECLSTIAIMVMKVTY